METKNLTWKKEIGRVNKKAVKQQGRLKDSMNKKTLA